MSNKSELCKFVGITPKEALGRVSQLLENDNQKYVIVIQQHEWVPKYGMFRESGSIKDFSVSEAKEYLNFLIKFNTCQALNMSILSKVVRRVESTKVN